MDGMQVSPVGTLAEASDVRSAYDALLAALAAERCVILDGGTAGARARAPDDAVACHRSFVRAGCDVVTTNTRRLLAAADGRGRHTRWMQSAQRSLRLARQAIAEEGREGEVAVAFALDADVDRPDAPETVRLLSRALAAEPPDVLVVEGLSVMRPTLYATVEALVAVGVPLWLSFRRCRHGLCGVYGQHWGGPEGDAFGRGARRFEELGVSALLLGCIPPDHVDGMLSYLRDFTDLPLGVHPNLGYLTSDGWHVDDDSDHAGFARMALRWREEGAQLIGGCCGVGADEIGAARAALAGTRPGRPRRDEGGSHELGGARAAPPEPWGDDGGRSLSPLEFPDLVDHGEAFLPSQGSFLVWRHLFRERIGRGASCLDVGCGSGLQAIQLALNGAEQVHAIDVESDAIETTLVNAFRNGVVDRVSTALVDLRAWVPETRYDVIVASLHQRPVDHLIRILPRALADDGVAYVLQVALLSQARTTELLAGRGLRTRVLDFGLLEVCGAEVMVGYLLEIGRR
jgi:S-methylmethionine-dependent homocysteine/selenocysteine methylase/precorrin-6B methylase 2